MPLCYANIGETNIIKKIGGSPEVKKHLENLGFVIGGNVQVISAFGGNVIV
ncbi:MAG: ferrous iron transport protein A, partial [Clostridia bacterium]|nr:ferrous iron transport protein A [Clostridia bacterium]